MSLNWTKSFPAICFRVDLSSSCLSLELAEDPEHPPLLAPLTLGGGGGGLSPPPENSAALR